MWISKICCEYHKAPMMNLMAYEGGDKNRYTESNIRERLKEYKSKTDRKGGKKHKDILTDQA